jgi:hypothetical protein
MKYFNIPIDTQDKTKAGIAKIILAGYKHEMILAFSTIIICIMAMCVVSYKSPIILLLGISFMILVFLKYLKDRKQKVTKDINEIIGTHTGQTISKQRVTNLPGHRNPPQPPVK